MATSFLRHVQRYGLFNSGFESINAEVGPWVYGISSEICLLRLTKLERPMCFSDASKKYSLSGYLGGEKDC